MSDRVPSIFMLVPGPWRRPGELIDQLRGRGIESGMRADSLVAGSIYVDVVEDDHLAAGFAVGRQGALPDPLRQAVGACRYAAVIEVAQRLDECAALLAELGRALRELGGVAIRMEASGAASAWEPWLEQIESGDAQRLYASGVVIVEGDDSLFTCGMHQFDLPDAEIGMSDPGAAMEWLDAFCIFQLLEQPALATGHTFCPDADTPRRTFERWPDHRHHPDDGRHNPFGVWRFLPEDAVGLDAENPVPTIVPSLVAMLLASERSKGAALTRSEVERLVEKAPAIAMEIRDAAALERSRGYADIEPRLAWEQWQIVRTTMN